MDNFDSAVNKVNNLLGGEQNILGGNGDLQNIAGGLFQNLQQSPEFMNTAKNLANSPQVRNVVMQGLDKLQGNPNSPDNATGQNATQQLNPQAILQSEKLQEAMSPLLNSLQQNIDLKNEKDKKEVELLNQADPNVITNLAANVQHIVQENQQIKHTQAQQGVINQQIMDNLTQQSQSLQELIKLNQKPTPESNQTQP